MTQQAGNAYPQGPAYATESSTRPTVRLATWVNVVLILTLFAACSATNRPQVDSGAVANRVAGQVVGELEESRSTGTTSDDITQLCKLLAAVAVKQGLEVDDVLGEDLGTSCDDGARRR